MSPKWKMTIWPKLNEFALLITDCCEDRCYLLCYTKQISTQIIMSCEHWRLTIDDWIYAVCTLHMAELLYYNCCFVFFFVVQEMHKHRMALLFSYTLLEFKIHMNEATKSNKLKGINDAYNIQTVYICTLLRKGPVWAFFFNAGIVVVNFILNLLYSNLQHDVYFLYTCTWRTLTVHKTLRKRHTG